jgi:hypothetical protein
VYDNKTKLTVHISKFQADNSIFDKIKKKRKLKKKLKLKLKLGKSNSNSIHSKYKIITNQVKKGTIQSINKTKKKVFNNFNNINVKTDIRNYQKTLSTLETIPRIITKEKINTNSSRHLMNDRNPPKFSTRSIDTNKGGELNQRPIVFKLDKTGSPHSNNYKGKGYNKNIGTLNYKGKTDQNMKFENENSMYRFGNKKNINNKNNRNTREVTGLGLGEGGTVLPSSDSHIKNR